MAEPAESAVVQVEELRKEYAARRGAAVEKIVVLAGLHLTVRRGDSAAIMGPSGSGKSTLLHILGVLDRPTAGRVRLAGRDPFALSEAEAADFRNRELGFVFQDHYLLPQCSALENVLVPTLVRREERPEAAERARGLLKRLGLGQRMEHRPAELSGGERQRVAIARALINAPKILLCDEPTGNLDQAAGQSIAECLENLQRDDEVALVVVTHNEQFAKRFNRLLRLVGGSLEDG